MKICGSYYAFHFWVVVKEIFFQFSSCSGYDDKHY